MNGRSPFPSENRVPFVSRRRKIIHKKRRKPKNKDNCVDLILYFIHAFGYLRSALDRLTVITRLYKYAKEYSVIYSRRFDFRPEYHRKALHYAHAKLFKLIGLERDDSVLVKLFACEARFCCPLIGDLITQRAADIEIPFLINFIAEIKCARVRFCAWERVSEMWREFTNPDMLDSTIELCLHMISNFREALGKVTGATLDCARGYFEEGRFEEAEVIEICDLLGLLLFALSAEQISRLCRSEILWSVILESMQSEPALEERTHEYNVSTPAWMLIRLLEHSTLADRNWIREHFEDGLGKAMMKMRFDRLYMAMAQLDIVDVIVSDRSLLTTLMQRLKNGCPSLHYDSTNRFIVTCRLLQYGLMRRDKLEMLLGYGILVPAARYFAVEPQPGGLGGRVGEARIFRAVLAAHPEWNESFRRATATENPISEVALLGQRIPPRRHKSALYILIDEDEEF